MLADPASQRSSDVFVRVCGRLDAVRDYFNKKVVVEWNYLEDLALTKPADYQEPEVLLKTKGWKEIKTRREFLSALPIISEVDHDEN